MKMMETCHSNVSKTYRCILGFVDDAEKAHFYGDNIGNKEYSNMNEWEKSHFAKNSKK